MNMNLQALLSNGSHTISHTKKDGSVKVRCVTLDPCIIGEQEFSSRDIKKASGVIRVWDVNKGGWVAIYPETVEVHT